MKWKSGNVSTDYYYNGQGKILGKVCRSSFSDDTYYAEAFSNNLGEYIDMKSAKAAVEEAVANPVIDDEDRVSPVYTQKTYTVDFSDENLKKII